MKRICFLIRSLGNGGAERQLLALARGLDKSRFEVTIVTFYGGGHYGEAVKQIPSVRTISLDKGGRWDVVPFFFRLIKTVRGLRPNVLHAYMIVPNIVSILLKPFLPRTRIVWGIRCSDQDAKADLFDRVTFALEIFLSRFAHHLVANSHTGKKYYVQHGSPEARMTVIPNGIDTERFVPDREAGRRLRAEWGLVENRRAAPLALMRQAATVPGNGDWSHAVETTGVAGSEGQGEEEVILIGLIGRIHPKKDPPNFLRAATELARDYPQMHFVCVGDGSSEYRERMRTLCRELGIEDRVLWPGVYSDMMPVYNALDILVSASAYGEGFSNVIGEAMACGVPCVVTDVGDSAWIVGEAGIVVPPGDSKALADACREMLTSDLRAGGEQGRQRILNCFSLQPLIEQSEKVLAA